MELGHYDDALAWATEAGGKRHVLLGNGFSMAYNPSLFGYRALAAKAEQSEYLSAEVAQLMDALGTPDFEATMHTLEAAIATLVVLDESGHSSTIDRLRGAVDELREALAQSIAGLHPERPFDISTEAYLSVRRFLEPFTNIYTVSYDLLLYWALMQEVTDGTHHFASRSHDDGFRDSGVDGDTTVLWDIYDPHGQTVHYLHGALHLFLGTDGLRKLTWVRTDVALIDQVREQLAVGRYPLYVAESDSASKLDKINRSAYLSKALRSFKAIGGTKAAGGSLVIYGHSLDANDDHILTALIRSTVRRVAVSIYGDPASEINRRITTRAERLVGEREADGGPNLEMRFYDAESAALWQ